MERSELFSGLGFGDVQISNDGTTDVQQISAIRGW